MKKKVFIFIILSQFVLIIFLFFQIKNKTNNTLGISINTIRSKDIQISVSNGLKYFYEPKANTTIEEHKDWLPNVVKYTINSDSLNERFDYQIKKSEDTYRIITLGDSFTYGLSVSTADNWTEILEDKLNKECKIKKFKKIEVINLGVDGYDIPYEVERYRKRGIKYNPDMILWMLFDPIRIKEYMTPIINACQLTYEKDPLKYIDCWVKSEDLLIKKLGKPKIISFLKEKFQSISKYFNKNVVVLDFLNNHNSILNNINKIKILNNFKIAKYLVYGERDNKYYLYDGHPNQAGHKKIAEDVFEYLTKNKLIPCN